MISEKLVNEYTENGAVCLRNVFDKKWVDTVAEGIKKTRANPSDKSESLKSEGGRGGAYFNDYCNWKNISEFEDFAFNSPAAEIVGKLTQTKKVVFYHEHVLVKEPGSLKETPFHVDQSYYPVDGNKVCSIWMPVDPVTKETCVQFVKGSHRWNKWFCPRKFATFKNYQKFEEGNEKPENRQWENVPDNFSDKKYEMLTWDLQPGDCIVFHMRTMHGAPGNTSLTTSRRILSTRWLGEDAVFATRPWQVSPPITGGLQPGQHMQSDDFPLVWQQSP